MAQFSRMRRPKPSSGRVIAVFGATDCGAATVIDILREACKTQTAVITVAADTTLEELSDRIDEIRANKQAEVIFLDGFPRNPDDVQALFDNSWCYVNEGAIVQVRRGLTAGIADVTEYERKIHDYDIPYFTVMNEPGRLGLASAVEQLITFAQITH